MFEIAQLKRIQTTISYIKIKYILFWGNRKIAKNAYDAIGIMIQF